MGALYLVFWSRGLAERDSHTTKPKPLDADFEARNDGAISPVIFVILLVLLFNKQYDVDSYLSGMKGSKGYVNIKLH